VDLLYPESLVRSVYGVGRPAGPRSLGRTLQDWVLRRHVRKLFAGAQGPLPEPMQPAPLQPATPPPVPAGAVPASLVRSAGALLAKASRPLLLIGSQATQPVEQVEALRGAVERLGIPCYLTGMARGLLGRRHPLQLRHRRRQALREADLVILAGVPADFRLNYGRDLPSRGHVIAVNRSRADLRRNRRPDLGVAGDPGAFLRALAQAAPPEGWARPEWARALAGQEREREAEIEAQAAPAGDGVNPVRLCQRLEEVIGENSVIVGDGGDFVATASYVVRPRGPLSWLDPGAFGTLGSGAGFALGARLCRPEAEVWILYGDGSVGYSLAEWDTFVRHRLPVLAVVGNDGAWSQIAREQVEVFGDDVGTVLGRAAYHEVARGFGAEGLAIASDEEAGPTLRRARELADQGRPVLVNAYCAPTDFRKGAISV
jgi:acetolactate synthase-1/2/3 large subunit